VAYVTQLPHVAYTVKSNATYSVGPRCYGAVYSRLMERPDA